MTAPTAEAAVELGLNGAPAPAAVRADPALLQAYRHGRDQRAGAAGHPLVPAAVPRRRPARSGAGAARRRLSAAGASPAGAALGNAFSPTAAADRLTSTGTAGRIRRAGAGGGLLLSLVVYPLVLATVRYGAAGPGQWFRAKWLNQTSTAPSSTPTGREPAAFPLPPYASVPVPQRTPPTSSAGAGATGRKSVTA